MSKFLIKLNAFLKQGKNNDLNAFNYMFDAKDDDCVDRIQVTHHFLRSVFNGNFSAPLDTLLVESSSCDILDIACGPGTFICDLSSDRRFKNANFVGVDIVNVFPSQKPQNVQFMESNIYEGMPLRDSSFDVVFSRLLITANTVANWEKLLTHEIVRLVRSGGWIEILEPDLVWRHAGPSTTKLIDAFHKFLRSRKMDPAFVHRIPELIANTGQFGEVKKVVAVARFGKRGGKLGELGQELTLRAFLEASSKLMPLLRMDNAQYNMLLKEVSQEITNGNQTQHLYRFFAQKL